MKVSEILKKNEVTISCEIFPPKQGAQLQNYKAIAAEIAKLKPAYISCTYGATGGTSDYTVEIADAINSYGVPAIAHLTCVSSTREKVHTVISELKERGIENILALRGDIPTNTDFPLPDQYHHAIELIREIREDGDFCIGGACYPEGHPEAANMNEDLDHLKEKVDAGCEYLTTQMFFDNNIYYRFLYKALAKGIDVPQYSEPPYSDDKMFAEYGVFTISGADSRKCPTTKKVAGALCLFNASNMAELLPFS